MPKETVLDSIFDDRDQGLLAKRSEYEKEIEYEIKMDGNEERLRKFIDSIYNQKLKNKINNLLELTLEDMLKRESASLDKYYKQDFKDGINLLIECIK